MQVAINELKAGLSGFVARARKGEVIVITSHDKPVARLVGAPPQASGGVAALVASGAAVWSGGKPPPHQPAELPLHTRSMSEMVVEDRG